MLPPAEIPPSRKIGVLVARLFVVLSSVYLAVVIGVIIKPEDVAFEKVTIPSYYLAVMFGLLYGSIRTPDWIKMAWLTTYTIACLGRGITLTVFDIDYLTQLQQFAAAISWFLLWVGGILAALALTANEILRRE